MEPDLRHGTEAGRFGAPASNAACDRVIDPALTRIAESSPQFMGVPLPLVLGALGLAVRARRFVRLRVG